MRKFVGLPSVFLAYDALFKRRGRLSAVLRPTLYARCQVSYSPEQLPTRAASGKRGETSTTDPADAETIVADTPPDLKALGLVFFSLALSGC